MKYAIISDIHGNIDALLSVLKDAESFDVNKYIFVGDYCSNLHCPNKVVETIRGIKDKIIVKGNEEDYLIEYAKQDQRTWTDGQFQAFYWLYKNLTDSNHSYLGELTKSTTFVDGSTHITVTHKSSDLYGDVEYKEFNSASIAQKYQSGHTVRSKILHDIQEYICSNNDFQSAIQSLSEGIYICGHTHVQWHLQCKNRTFINPGSCGLPLDGMQGAPYTILNIEGNNIHITEHRVQYDMDKLRHELISSDLYKNAPVWSGITLEAIDTGYDRVQPFLHFAEEYADKINDHVRPYSVKTWTEAFSLWQEKQTEMLLLH